MLRCSYEWFCTELILRWLYNMQVFSTCERETSYERVQMELRVYNMLDIIMCAYCTILISSMSGLPVITKLLPVLTKLLPR